MKTHTYETLVENALDAFWEVVAKEFPQAESGDLSPLMTVQLQFIAENAVTEWIGNNVPQSRPAMKPLWKPDPFDRYEIHGIRKFGRGQSRYAEQVPDKKAQFWSLFGHIPGQGLECIGDFETREFAAEIYARITGAAYAAQ